MATKKKMTPKVWKQHLEYLTGGKKEHFTSIFGALFGEELAPRIHALNDKWWRSLKTGRRIKRNFGELIALTHSELSEALEGHRKNKQDEHLPHRPSAEVELADAMIRILDLGEGFGFDVWGALVEKLWYNLHREDHKHEHRKGKHGKKY